MYYRKEFSYISANPSQIMWQLDDDMSVMLPVMQTDIMLTYRNKILIIDAKYYSHMMQNQFDKKSIISSNLYQIFTYVKNKAMSPEAASHTVSGMLLYAKTDEEVYPSNEYSMSGNKIEVRTLDLDENFDCIKAQLNGIVKNT